MCAGTAVEPLTANILSRRLVIHAEDAGVQVGEVPEDDLFVPYATFVADEYYFLDVEPNDMVIDAGTYVGDLTIKAAEHVKLVIAVDPDPVMRVEWKKFIYIVYHVVLRSTEPNVSYNSGEKHDDN